MNARHPMIGACEAAIILATVRNGISVMDTCGDEGLERLDLAPAKAVGMILCDEHYEDERARRLPGR